MSIQLRDVIRMILALGIAFYFQQYFFSNEYWLILSAFFGIALQNEYYYESPNLSLLITAAIASVIVLAANIFSYNIYIYGLFLLFVLYFSITLGYEHRRYWLHAFVISFYTVLAYVLLTNVSGSMTRFEGIWLGFLIAIIIRNIVFTSPDKIKKELIKEILLTSNAYLQKILLCLQRKDYTENNFYYEKIFHTLRHRLLEKLIYLHHVSQNDVQPKYIDIEAQLQKLYETILSLGNILLRIEDVAIFEMVTKEFAAMSDAINEIFKKLAACEPPQNLDSLSYQIQQLQDVNVRGVQLIAKDPLIFSLFIEDWKLLERRLELLFAGIQDKY